MNKQSETILVLGSNGKTGGRVLQQLKQLGVPVREGSRNATIRFDWEDQSTWQAALQNITAVYITFQPDLAVPGAVQAISQFCRMAKESGVQKLVLLSGRGEKEAEDCEKIVQTSGLKYTIVRASWFNQNFSESYFLQPIIEGVVALPLKDVREPFIDADDIADVAVAALTRDGHDGKLYEVTGPRLLTFKQAVQDIAAAAGREIRYVEISMEEYVTEMEQLGIPKDYIMLIRYLFTEVLDGRNAYITDGVEEALQRKPKDFSSYAAEVAAAGVWG